MVIKYYYGKTCRVIQYRGGTSIVHKADGGCFELHGDNARLMERNIRTVLMEFGDAESPRFAAYLEWWIERVNTGTQTAAADAGVSQ